ncbi:MAG: winged helix-turn-helix domain-containing protein [Burkholderiaceae bacterium]
MTGRFRFGGFEVLVAERTVLASGRILAIGPRAFDVLLVLLEQAGQVIGRDEILDRAWPGLVVEENNLSVQISSLRKLLGADAIKTVSGRGYQFAWPVQVDVGPPAVAASAPTPGWSAPAGEATDRERGARDPAGSLREPYGASNLPQWFDTPIGRDADLMAVDRLLHEQRLVTITGPAGIGKTTVAMAAARTWHQRERIETQWIELSGVRDPGLTTATIAHALKVSLSGQRDALEELIIALRSRQLLVVLDNCEHLVAGVSRLALAVMRQTTGVRFLVTTQEILHVPGEAVHRVEALSLSGCGSSQQPSAAVTLFIERARALDSKFARDAGNAAIIDDICRGLEGIPLAIELAAARVHMYSLEGVRDRLSDGLRLFSRGSRVEPRHRTLYSALDWSHGLLDEPEQTAFRRLAVFGDGFTERAGARIIADERIDEFDACELMASLLDKSLIVLDKRVPGRYRFLEVTRSYATQKLHESGEEPRLLARHAQVTLAGLREAIRARATEALWADMNNMRRAYAWAMGADGDKRLAVGLATASAVVLAVEGFVAEALARHLEVQPFLDQNIPDDVAALYWQWYGRIGTDCRLPVQTCIEAFDQALTMFRGLGNIRHQHACHRMKAQALIDAGEFDAAARSLFEAYRLELDVTPAADRMRRLRVQGLLEERSGRARAALQTWAQALQMCDQFGITRYAMIVRVDIARAHLALGNLDECIARFGELAGFARDRAEGGLTMSYALTGLTTTHLLRGEDAQALAVAREAIPVLRQAGLLAVRGDMFALLLARLGRPQLSAQILRLVDTVRQATGTVRDPVEARLRREAIELIEGGGVRLEEPLAVSLHEGDLPALLLVALSGNEQASP